ncbi:MAG TPA: RtcB family protein [Gemmatimonadales bacterium]|nr:RtcB family protein [Gemmatimonadales bacterium]
MSLSVFGTHDEATLAQLRDVASRAERAALMADGHKGYVMPIGGVAAYRNKVSVVGVGFDIACGNAAILTDRTLSDFTPEDLTRLADEIQCEISFGVGRTCKADDAPVDNPLFMDPAWEAIPGKNERDRLRAKARGQLGTVGSGNHYVDVFADELGRIWVGVHFGSRGFGHTVASGFLALSQNRPWGSRAPEAEVLLDLNTPTGDAYWELMNLAGNYAYAGREWVARKVVGLLGGRELELIHNHHNFAWRETHDGEDFIVVRKGATPAFPGQRGFVGGSMGDDAVIVEGAPGRTEEQRQALFSTVHGAGRVMSRTEARGKMNWKTREIKSPGKVSWAMLHEWVGQKGVILRGGGLDESPHAYRRLPDVLAAQGDTVRVIHTLRPLIVVMAGENEFDPYKD